MGWSVGAPPVIWIRMTGRTSLREETVAMANRSFLVRVDQRPCPMDRVKEDQVLCAASYTIPVFWFMLFDSGSIVETQARDEDEAGVVEYPCLSAVTEEALQLAYSRWAVVEKAIGPTYKPLFRTFCEFIKAVSGGYVQCETAELWMMEADTDAFLSYLHERLSAFDEPLYQRAGFFGLRKAISKSWNALLMESNAVSNKRIASAKPESLCGYGWVREVPWGEGKGV